MWQTTACHGKKGWCGSNEKGLDGYTMPARMQLTLLQRFVRTQNLLWFCKNILEISLAAFDIAGNLDLFRLQNDIISMNLR